MFSKMRQSIGESRRAGDDDEPPRSPHDPGAGRVRPGRDAARTRLGNGAGAEPAGRRGRVGAAPGAPPAGRGTDPAAVEGGTVAPTGSLTGTTAAVGADSGVARAGEPAAALVPASPPGDASARIQGTVVPSPAAQGSASGPGLPQIVVDLLGLGRPGSSPGGAAAAPQTSGLAGPAPGPRARSATDEIFEPIATLAVARVLPHAGEPALGMAGVALALTLGGAGMYLRRSRRRR
jgi:hypothetical protein